MKNIHLLPTYKPSRVYNILESKRIGITSNDPFYTENFGGGTQNQHIYITSDEEIKEGDWFYNPATKEALYASKEMLSWNCDTTQEHKGWKKIILTTDQDLIADGVQAIDDDFLEWFVKNSSCESIEVKNISIKVVKGYKNNGEIDCYHTNGYEIIIPQEESKTGYSKSETEFLGIEFTLKDGSKQFVPKQEKLEEAADNWVRKPVIGTKRESFIAGVNWQAERMYSEEEVKQIIDATLIEYSDFVLADIPEWFEQFKKK